jgi:hypothetical protein
LRHPNSNSDPDKHTLPPGTHIRVSDMVTDLIVTYPNKIKCQHREVHIREDDTHTREGFSEMINEITCKKKKLLQKEFFLIYVR